MWTDKYGRVKVHFHWDRAGKRDGSDSCWIRVAQPWAGDNWGMLSLPRVSHEVVVTFLGGDPDRPIITGSVYNARQTPPFALPDDQHLSGIKSRTLGGDYSDFHGLAFSDADAAELVHLRSQKDLVLDAKNDHTVVVPNIHTTHVGSIQISTVGGGGHGHGPSGSGSGGGEDRQNREVVAISQTGKGVKKGGEKGAGFVEDLAWGPAKLDSTVIGSRLDVVFGFDSKLVAGAITEYAILKNTHFYVDPFEIMPGMGLFNAIAQGTGQSGHSNTVYGRDSDMLLFGPRRKIQRAVYDYVLDLDFS